MTPPAGQRRPDPAPASTAWSLRLRLRLPEPYDLGWMLGFLAGRAAPALERVEPGLLVRVIRLDYRVSQIPVAMSCHGS